MSKFVFSACFAALIIASFGQAATIHDAATRGDIPAIEQLLKSQPQLLEERDPFGCTPLNIAAKEGNLQIAKLLVKKGALIDAGDNERTTPLQIASSGGKLEVVKYLLSKGASLDLQDDNGLSALQWAAYAGKLEVVKHLLSKGANVEIAKPNGSTSLHGAANRGDLEMVKYLLAKGAQVDPVNQGGYSPMLSAAAAGHTEVVRYLLDQGADIHRANGEGATALDFAIQRGDRDFTEYLISRGARIQYENPQAWQPLFGAVFSGNAEIAQLLLRNGANPNILHADGYTPLLAAVRNGYTALTEALLRAGANPRFATSQSGATSLHIAATKGFRDIAEQLLRSGADVNVADQSGKTPLDYALKYANTGVANLLQESGGEVVRTAADDGSSLLMRPVAQGEAVLWYLGHCGWAVKTQNHLLVFDYWSRWRDSDNPCLANGAVRGSELAGQNVEVFVTHDHADHYDSTIFIWDDQNKDLTYIFGFEPAPAPAPGTPDNQRPNVPQFYTGQEYVYTAPRTRTDLDGMKITTIRSNDAGVGYLVEVDGLTLYHAGDHAGWSAPEGREEFTQEINYLADLGVKADLAFVNVTGCRHSGHPEELYQSNLYTVDKLNPAIIIPTHGINNERAYREFAQRLAGDRAGVRVFSAENKGDHFVYRGQSIVETSSR